MDDKETELIFKMAEESEERMLSSQKRSFSNMTNILREAGLAEESMPKPPPSFIPWPMFAAYMASCVAQGATIIKESRI